jgi:hypothetical protein
LQSQPLAGRHYVLEKGRIAWCGTSAALKANQDLILTQYRCLSVMDSIDAVASRPGGILAQLSQLTG